MKKLLIGFIALCSTSVFAQIDVYVQEKLSVEKTFAGPQKAAVTNMTSGQTFGLESIYILANDQNAHLFCVSKNFDKAISYRKSGSARTLATVINPDGSAEHAKFEVFTAEDTILSDVNCTINR